MPAKNLILIMLDSLRRDHLGYYGNDWIKTPNLDALAAESVVFDNAYPEGLPTIPQRTCMLTGQCTLPFRPWQPLVKEDVTAAELLRSYGFKCSLISDTYHMMKPDMNFHRNYTSFQWIRGQEGDAWISAPPRRDINHFIKPAMQGDRVAVMLQQYLANTDAFAKPEDWFCGQVMTEAVTWLDAALDPHVDPTTVRAYLLAAQEALRAADDPNLAHCVGELRAVIQTIRPSHSSVTTTPRPTSPLEWPW